MRVDEALVGAAVAQLAARWPDRQWAVAAAAYVVDMGGRTRIVTGVSLDNINSAATLCAETGPICSAYADGAALRASVCVARGDTAAHRGSPAPPNIRPLLVPSVPASSRERLPSGYHIFAPCGVCQERLALWGSDVEVAVPDGKIRASRRLDELQPHYWARTLTGGNWPNPAEHAEV